MLKITVIRSITILILCSSWGAQATLITRDIVGPNTIGSYTYDTTTLATGTLGFLTGFDQYDITALDFTFNNGSINQTWSLADQTFAHSGVFRASMDPLGTWVESGLDVTAPTWGSANFTNAADYILTFSVAISTLPSPHWDTSFGSQSFVVISPAGLRAPGNYASFSTSSIPAPTTLALFALGLAGLGWSRHKKA